ncbi:hypothetical protein POM88_006890 [Heracleum sosnowskyi]|uniref:Uncharacterized protein n=1 Tax=Heracleum sosnowskyi TaxID=360622 RepID=A0AAD8J3I4_9APIA|nr:hypothetical protein POM88_006890 [Heracleum sosnowskyi]
MDENMTVNQQPSIFRQLLSAVVPMLLVAMSYIDPGKWATAVEGGARYESNIILLMLVFNLAAILCQYLSARIVVVTEKDLAQLKRRQLECLQGYEIGAFFGFTLFFNIGFVLALNFLKPPSSRAIFSSEKLSPVQRNEEFTDNHAEEKSSNRG